ncbi:MAG: hypothetical protein IPF99_09275 [Deltaproteobacteria bacterium]|nr:hypothetical protein [Deltaproteobacteria bacterium]
MRHRRRAAVPRALLAAGAVVVLGGAGGGMLAWQRKTSRQQAARREALAWADPMARVEGCLFGTDPMPARPDELSRHLRRVALGPDAGRAWPSRCLDLLGANAARDEAVAVERLRVALRADDGLVAALRREGASAELGAWRPRWSELRARVAQRRGSWQRAPPSGPRPWSTPRARAPSRRAKSSRCPSPSPPRWRGRASATGCCR